ncbi:MAG: VCBS repeat-containing protein, partial [Bacteroidota bacterium]
KETPTPEVLYTAYCGGCHASPEVAHVPKAIWNTKVLPEMAARLGYRYRGYDPMANYSLLEQREVQLTAAYPSSPLIDSISWQRLHDWVVSQAPDSIPVALTRAQRNDRLTQFDIEPVRLDTVALSTITYVDFQEDEKDFVIGDAFGNVLRWPGGKKLPYLFASPVMTYQADQDIMFTEVGYMNPSDQALGKVHLSDGARVRTIMSGLKRPVYSRRIDLDEDGQKEVLVCEFGNYGGQLSLLRPVSNRYDKQTLLPVPGTIKFDVRDMNADGKKDIIALASQGNEGIFILYQQENLSFSTKQVIKLGPEYGSSWFEMVDFDKDGDLDIVYANGDNADYSVFPKPYHGVRLFECVGPDEYQERWFYPIYGATRVLPADYDLDGDIDFAVLAFFPEFGQLSREGFVFLENQDTDALRFKSYTFDEAEHGRWLVMDKGDVDGDGDEDLLLGAFMLYPGSAYDAVTEQWIAKKVDLYLLRNRANREK